MLAAAEAGADVVDVCTDAMAGLTSQPAIGAVLNSIKGSETLDNPMNLQEILKLNTYWEQARALYSPYESGIKSGSASLFGCRMGSRREDEKWCTYNVINLKFSVLTCVLSCEITFVIGKIF